jgi:hypothetical protein
MAWVANKIHELYPSSTVITRFLGTTPASSDVLLLVRGLCTQLMVILGDETPENVEMSKNGTSEEVNALLKSLLAVIGQKNEPEVESEYLGDEDEDENKDESKDKNKDEKKDEKKESNPVYIFIDSIDQLMPNNNAYMLDWLPLELPPNVHLVVSVLIPSKEEEANPNLIKMRPPNLHTLLRSLYESVPNKERFFCRIPQLNQAEAEQIVDNRLNLKDEHGRSRALTPEQKEVVLKSTTGTSFTPLYLCIALDLALQWKSYTPLSECTIAGTTRDIILQLFR